MLFHVLRQVGLELMATFLPQPPKARGQARDAESTWTGETLSWKISSVRQGNSYPWAEWRGEAKNLLWALLESLPPLELSTGHASFILSQ